MKGVVVVTLSILCSLAAAEVENETALINRLFATENLVKELLQEVNTLKSLDIVRDMKVANLEKELRLQRQRNSEMDIMLKKLKLCDKGQDSGQARPSGVSRNRIRRQDIEGPIAFFAKMENHLEHASTHQTVIFDVIVTNLGNAYSNQSGIFIAPLSGTYVFSTTLVSRNFAAAHAQFAVNGNAITNMYVSAGDGNTGDDTTSQTIVLLLQKGDEVSVQNLDPDKGFFGVSHSTFSGFLLQEDYSSPSVIGK